MVGPVLSRLTFTSVGSLTLPASSVQVPDTVWSAAWAVTGTSAVHVATPLGPLSPLAVNSTTTSVLFQPASFGCGLRDAVGALGAWESILNAGLFWSPAGVALPAASVNSGLLRVTAAPSPLLVTVCDSCTGPESESVASNRTVTGEVYQPAEPATPETTPW